MKALPNSPGIAYVWTAARGFDGVQPWPASLDHLQKEEGGEKGERMAETSYDLIVAGAGTGGIIMAARIAQR